MGAKKLSRIVRMFVEFNVYLIIVGKRYICLFFIAFLARFLLVAKLIKIRNYSLSPVLTGFPSSCKKKERKIRVKNRLEMY